MARDFVAGSTQYLRGSSTPITAYPFTMACWFQVADVTNAYCLMGIFDDASANNRWYLEVAGNIANDPFRATTKQTTTTAATANGVTANTWHHGCGVYSGTNLREAWLNGTKGTDDLGSQTPTGVDRVSVGIGDSSSQFQALSGKVAHAAIWSVVLSASEIGALAAGLNPLRVRPESLVGYWPIWGLHSPEIDLSSGGRLLTLGNAPTRSTTDAPVLWKPYRDSAPEIGAGGGGGDTYNETVTETVSLAQALANAATFANTHTESVTLAQALADAMTMASALTESVSLASTFTDSGNIYDETLTETVTLADSYANTVVFANSHAEAVALASAFASVGTFASSLSEAVALADEYAATGGEVRIWTVVSPAGGSWTTVTPAGGTWTPQ